MRACVGACMCVCVFVCVCVCVCVCVIMLLQMCVLFWFVFSCVYDLLLLVATCDHYTVINLTVSNPHLGLFVHCVVGVANIYRIPSCSLTPWARQARATKRRCVQHGQSGRRVAVGS